MSSSKVLETVFFMPFHPNFHFLCTIRAQVGVRHGLRIGVIAILHTFNGRLEFNSHVHTMVTAGGLHDFSGIWVSRVYCDHNRLMKGMAEGRDRTSPCGPASGSAPDEARR